MIIIRLSRTGNKKKPFYHVVLANKKSPRDGRYVERLGFFNPIAKGKAVELKLDIERIRYWVTNGAQMSDKINFLLKKYEKLSSNNN